MKLVIKDTDRETIRVGVAGPQGPQGPQGPPGPPGPSYPAENKGAVSIPGGGPAAVHSSGIGVVPAEATGPATAAVGLATAPIAAGFVGLVQTVGLMTLADWSAATVEASATLAPKATYYLSPTPGKLTITPPTTGGQILQIIGYAVTADTLEMSPSEPILL